MWTLLTRQNFREFSSVHSGWTGQFTSGNKWKLRYLQSQDPPITHISQTHTGVTVAAVSNALQMWVSLNSSQRKPVVEASQHPLPCVHLYWLQASRVNSANQWSWHWSFHTQWHPCPGRLSPFRFSFMHVFVTYHKLQHRIMALIVMVYVTACFIQWELWRQDVVNAWYLAAGRGRDILNCRDSWM